MPYPIEMKRLMGKWRCRDKTWITLAVDLCCSRHGTPPLYGFTMPSTNDQRSPGAMMTAMLTETFVNRKVILPSFSIKSEYKNMQFSCLV